MKRLRRKLRKYPILSQVLFLIITPQTSLLIKGL